jgi:hypothetical protein
MEFGSWAVPESAIGVIFPGRCAKTLAKSVGNSFRGTLAVHRYSRTCTEIEPQGRLIRALYKHA